jgi:hypothetical protein
MDATFDYSNWSDAELARAETTATHFLKHNQKEISRVFAHQGRLLENLFALLRQPNLTVEQRLDCFARIAETADAVRDCANGFFELGAQPLVARTLEGQ